VFGVVLDVPMAAILGLQQRFFQNLELLLTEVNAYRVVTALRIAKWD
jgi:hypothetical protein